ncbi:hypothetical protein EIP91_010581 [Steccherinum ochraceum]|uniref:Cytochrome P450 67 n=1 Tax=Steccherinum ochraceum TaxID=92696 RepID=A0A4R0RQP0_9APHY|nr:hypothetical protein EIP91_010581 [Steccherinum ochraceum]
MSVVGMLGGLADLTLKDALVRIGGAALCTHVIFNRVEPLSPPLVAFLLVVEPLALGWMLLQHQTHFALSFLISVLITFSAYHATLITSIILYRLSPFHPLARYPGPLRLKLSQVFGFQIALEGGRHRELQKMHEEYDTDVLRLGPNEIIIRDASAISAIMGTNGLGKGPGADGRAGYRTDRTLINWRDAEVHAKRRKPWIRGTNTTALKEYEPVIAARAGQLVDMVLRGRDGTVNLSQCIKFFAYDFMSDMAFGGGGELMRDGDVHGLMHRMDAGIKAAILVESLPWLSFYMEKVPSMVAKFRQLREQGAQRARQRILRGALTKDLFHYLNNDDGAEAVSPSVEAVAAEGVLVILAGSETTSGVLSTIMYLLMRNPDVYKKLQQEVDKFYPPGENALDCKCHSEMTYLEAVINESLRLFPVQPSGSQRATRGKGIVAGNHYIPPYTSVRINTWSIHRDPRNFSPSPESFWPERWLIAEDPSSYKSSTSKPFIHNANAFIPFSFGPSNCVGKNLALKEMKMVLCHLVQQVAVRFADGYDVESYEREMKDWFAMQVPELPVVVTQRSEKA